LGDAFTILFYVAAAFISYMALEVMAATDRNSELGNAQRDWGSKESVKRPTRRPEFSILLSLRQIGNGSFINFKESFSSCRTRECVVICVFTTAKHRDPRRVWDNCFGSLLYSDYECFIQIFFRTQTFILMTAVLAPESDKF
jgi:hypothetical protein